MANPADDQRKRRRPTVRITVDGKLALTVEQAAERYGIAPSSMRGELTRLGQAVTPAAMLDGRKPLYLASELDKAMANRKGRGAPGVPRPHRPPGDRAKMASRLRGAQ